MGNAVAKETRSPHSHSRYHPRSSSVSDARYHAHRESSRHRAADISAFLGLSDREPMAEVRRETRQERDARKREKERIARLIEREHSMKTEHVDGGYLVSTGIYIGSEDWNKMIVRQLIIERQLAPYWRGLDDFNESWAEHQIIAAARGLSIPPPDVVPPELECKLPAKGPVPALAVHDQYVNSVVPPAQSLPSDADSHGLLGTVPRGFAPGVSNSSQARTRAKTLAALSSYKTNADLTPREFQLPPDPFVNGQPMEVFLYKNGTECPICFLFYPPYLNQTRCCHQPICTECFVKIKRPDPHPPEHETDSGHPHPDSEDLQLVSEPATCPFCNRPEFGVTYSPPPFRRGLTYAPNEPSEPISLAPFTPPITRPRATSIPPDAPGVVTTDKIRPDWATKLASARAHAARRAAAATALHTAAFVLGPNEPRPFATMGRRGVLRRAAVGNDDNAPMQTTPPSVIVPWETQQEEMNNDTPEEVSSGLVPPRGSSRRSRLDQLEDMMVAEAIRQSIAAEEDRRRHEEKEVKKDTKKREKESKKTEKKLRKTGSNSANSSCLALDTGTIPFPRLESEPVSPAEEETAVQNHAAGEGFGRSSSYKGKAVAQEPAVGPSASAPQDPQAAPLQPTYLQPSSSFLSPSLNENGRQSHLRSTTSSSTSSLIESTSGEQIGSAASSNASNGSLETMFNFRSLAEVIDDEAKGGGASSEHTENPEPVEDMPVATEGYAIAPGGDPGIYRQDAPVTGPNDEMVTGVGLPSGDDKNSLVESVEVTPPLEQTPAH